MDDIALDRNIEIGLTVKEVPYYDAIAIGEYQISDCPTCGRERKSNDLIHISIWEGCSSCFAAVFQEHASLKNSVRKLKEEVENLRSKIRY